MYCNNCGREIKNGVKFCPYCGSPQLGADRNSYGGQNGGTNTSGGGLSDMPTGKKAALIVAAVLSVLAAIAVIATVVFLITGSVKNGKKDPEPAGEVVTETEQDTESDEEPSSGKKKLSKEEQQEQDDCDAWYQQLLQENLDGAYSSDEDLIEQYKTDVREQLDNLAFEKARQVMGRWQNLIDSIHGSGQYEMNVEQVDVSDFPMIKIYVRVQDLNTMKAVDTLTTDGFYVYEKPDGASGYERREVTRASQLNNQERVNISMVADVSGSMSGKPLSDAKWVMGNFLNNIQTEAGDRVSLISFADQVDIQTSFTGDTGAVKDAVNRLSTYDMTALYDALYVAINQTAAQDGAKCVIAFTDGRDNISKCTPDIIVELARRYSIPIFIIGVGNDLDNYNLNYIAESTNGFYKTVGQVSGMSEIYDAIFREQKEMYLIEYETLQKDNKDVSRNLNLDYVDDQMAVRQEYCYVPSVYMEVNTSMAQMFVNDFIIYDSDRRFVTSADLDRLNQEQLRLARNEIYARRGRRFNDQYLQNYFNGKSWYHGSIAPNAFQESVFNAYERANAYFIADYERLKGYIK